MLNDTESMTGNTLSQANREKKVAVPAVHSSIGLWMIVDGIGLAIVAGATILEGMRLWKNSFHLFWLSQKTSLLYWFGGRSLQVSGLTVLIAFAASFQMFPILELIGMVLISTGPLLNLVACYLFTNNDDPHYLYKKEWASTELVELAGMLILDVSLIHMEEIYVLLAEVTGFLVLCCAAGLQFTYSPKVMLPSVSFRLDIVHSSECVGLIVLTVVAFAQYRMKLHKLEHQQKVHERHRVNHGSPTFNTIKTHNSSHTRHRGNSISNTSASPASVVDIEQPAVDKKCGRKVITHEDDNHMHIV